MQIEQEVLDKMIEEIKHIHAEAVHHMRDVGLEQLHQVQEHYEEKVQELTKQNDGLLGAVGHLQSERDQAIKALESQKALQSKLDEEIKKHVFELDRRHNEEQMKIKNEISGYRTQISDLKAKLKKQGKK